jgi:hypothetical protein
MHDSDDSQRIARRVVDDEIREDGPALHQSVRQVLSRVPQLRDLVERLEDVLERAQNLEASR